MRSKRQPKNCNCGSHAFVPCTKGRVAIFDVTDSAAVGRFNWTTIKPGGPTARRVYAQRRVMVGDELIAICLHKEIFGAAECQIDHINGDGLDCRRENLRAATNAQNQMNKITTTAKSGYRGVHKTKNGWLATISKTENGNRRQRQRFLGYHKTAIDAAMAYDRAAIVLFGEFARPNFNNQQRI